MEGFQSTSITNKLAEHLRRGELLDLAPDLALGSPVDEVMMMSWDGTHSIAASDIRELLRGRIVTDPDPRGLRLRAAYIRGRLDLDNLTTTVKLTLLDCLLDEGITAGAAHLPGLSLRRCLLTHASKPALYADELRTDAGVSFEGSTILTCSAEGALRMNGAHIGGQLDCSGATITNSCGPALYGERLKINDNILLSGGFSAVGAGEWGAVRLAGAHIGGQLDCSDATVTNGSGPALQGEHLHVDGNVLLRGDFTAHGDGAVSLRWARVGGWLDCSDATITNASGSALAAGAMHVAGSVLLNAGFTANGANERGAVRLTGARIGIQLECSGATITNPSGPAVQGERLHVGGDIFLRAGFTADGDGELGVVRLTGAHIGGQLDCSGAVVTSRSDRQHRWSLDGLTYTRLPLDPLGTGTAGWLDLLRTATPTYAAQPYQQLASVNQAAGHGSRRPSHPHRTAPSSTRPWSAHRTRSTVGQNHWPHPRLRLSALARSPDPARHRGHLGRTHYHSRSPRSARPPGPEKPGGGRPLYGHRTDRCGLGGRRSVLEHPRPEPLHYHRHCHRYRVKLWHPGPAAVDRGRCRPVCRRFHRNRAQDITAERGFDCKYCCRRVGTSSGYSIASPSAEADSLATNLVRFCAVHTRFRSEQKDRT